MTKQQKKKSTESIWETIWCLPKAWHFYEPLNNQQHLTWTLKQTGGYPKDFSPGANGPHIKTQRNTFVGQHEWQCARAGHGSFFHYDHVDRLSIKHHTDGRSKGGPLVSNNVAFWLGDHPEHTGVNSTAVKTIHRTFLFYFFLQMLHSWGELNPRLKRRNE